MDFGFTPEQEKLRQEIRQFLQENVTPELRAESQRQLGGPGPATWAMRRKLGEKGWLGIGWPKEYGGQGRSMMEQFIFFEEMERQRIDYGSMTVGSLAMALIRVGTEEQKREYLPPILQGRVDFCIGYTEPGAGTDLASLQTTAVRDGDDYLINGQKVFTTAAHHATHIWLLARTDATAPKHRGISLFLVPINTPGVTVRPLYTMGGGRTNEVFLDNVRVPAKCLIGEENKGFYYAAVALDFERIALGHYSALRQALDSLISFCKEFKVNGACLFDDPAVQDRLVQLHIEVELLRLMNYRVVWMIDRGLVPNAEASAQKIWGRDLRQRIADEALQMMGLYGQLTSDSPHAPLNGEFLTIWLQSPVTRFGGGTNEIQRDIIAQRGLGLPRG